MEHQKNEHKQKMKKMEAEMEQVFEMKVKEKMQKLKDSEIDVSTHLLIIVFSLFFFLYCLFSCLHMKNIHGNDVQAKK